MADKRDKRRSDPAPPQRPDPCVRPENEDDDGYDPWSDRQEKTGLFEEDPWD